MYSTVNFPTKKALKQAVVDGRKIGVYQPNDMFNTPIPQNGTVTLEGPHYPKPHTWYAQVVLQDGYITKVK